MRSMRTMRPRLSFADLERMPEDGRRYELYDGELSEVPSPTLRHQRIVMNLMEALREVERRTGGLVCISPIDLVLDAHNVVQPDLVFFGPERMMELDPTRVIRIAPDLAIEVLSPGTEATDRGRKLRLLARFGVPEYWLVDPAAETIEAHVLESARYVLDGVRRRGQTLTSRVAAGLAFPVARVFER
jgi:Uma2 family endonuclease